MPALLRPFVPARVRAGVVRSLHARDVWRRGPEACWARFEQVLDQLDARAPRDGFWTGPRIGAGDLAMAAQLRSMQTALTPWQAEAIGERPRLAAWITRVEAGCRPRLALAA